MTTTEPGCTTEGVQTKTCANCGDKQTRAVKAAGHKYGDWVVTTKPGCTTEGVETKTCTVCGDKRTRAVKATGHKYTWATITKPTCTAAGSNRGTCTVCKATTTQTVAALGHDYGEWELTTKPACLVAGEETSECKNCGDKRTREVAPLNHDLGEAVVVQEPTISNPGIAHRICVNCGDAFEEEIPCFGTDEASGITMLPSENAFPTDTELAVETISEGETLSSLNEAFKKISGNILAYEIAATNNGAEAQPDGTVKTIFPIPDGMNPANVALYYTTSDGTPEKLDALIDAENGTITAELSGFGIFVIAEEGVGVRNSAAFVWGGTAAGLAAVGGILVFALRKKKAKESV